MNDLKQNIKYFSFARFFCHDLLLWKKQRRNRRWQSTTTRNLSSVYFFFSILHSLENYFHISRKISHSHIFHALSYHVVAQMCRIKQNFKNHTRFLHSAIECEERIYVVLVWYYKHRFKREKFTQVSISFVSNNTPQDIVISNQNPEDALLI